MSVREAICVVWLNGRELSSKIIRKIESLTLQLPKRKAKSGTMVLEDSDFSLFDSRLFRKGQSIHFLLGWVNEAMPSGPYIIKTAVPNAPDNGKPTLTLKFQDLTHKMNKKQKNKRHLGNPTQILKKIAKNHGLGYNLSSIEGLTFTDDFPLIQASSTDAALIQKLATRYGYVWGVDGGTLYFKRPAEREIRRSLAPPVLSYRINDYSLRSFSPEFKFTSGKKRTKASQTIENLDFTKDINLGAILNKALAGDMDPEKVKKLLAENPDDSETALLIEERIADFTEEVTGSSAVAGFYHELVDSAETWMNIIAYEVTGDSPDLALQRIRAGSKIAKANKKKTEAAEDEENEESEQGDESGAASPSTEDEAKRRAVGKLSRAAIITRGTAIPTVGSMLYVPGKKVILSGVGKYLSGGYLITEVTHSYSNSGSSFSTALKVSRSKVLPGKKDQEEILSAEQKARMGSLVAGQPGGFGGGTGLEARGGGGPIREIEEALDSYQEGGELKSFLIDGEPDI